MQSHPTEAQRLFLKHMLDVNQGFYRPEIQGALTKSKSSTSRSFTKLLV